MRSQKLVPAISTVTFLILAPGTVAGLIPWAISRWSVRPAFFGIEALRWFGAALVFAGIVVLLESFARFAFEGLGTPAPPYPTNRLIVTGFYRYVRNPMYCAVAATIFGQALLLGDARLLLYGSGVALVFHFFVMFYEEPTLLRAYGGEYEAYRAHVRRWLPRFRAWPSDVAQ